MLGTVFDGEYGRREKRVREGVFKQPGVKKNRISRIMLKVKAQSINQILNMFFKRDKVRYTF